MSNNKLGIIIGTSFQFSKLLKGHTVQSASTTFGKADIFESGHAVIAFRHGKNGDIPAHRIRHGANIQALKGVGVRCIIGFQSVGSLKQALPPGSLILPHDYISLISVPTIFEKNTDPHIVPAFDEPMRQSVIQLLHDREIPVFEQGIYWQTQGPRFETRAEIHLISQFADCVGMTAASEATVAQEAGLAYCCICSVDNYAHGIGSPPLTEETFQAVIRKNTQKMETVLNIMLENSGVLTCPS